MDIVLRVQGLAVTQVEIDRINALLAAVPRVTRHKLSKLVCAEFCWRQGNGALKDQVCRSLLAELHRAGHIVLPVPRPVDNPLADRHPPKPVEVDQTVICASLKELGPAEFYQVRRTRQEPLFNWLLESEHYLKFTHPVGESLKFMVYAGLRPVALFSWRSAPRYLEPRMVTAAAAATHCRCRV